MNTTLGLAMLFGRFFLIIPTLAIAGSLVRKRRVPASAGTFPTAHAAVRRAGHRRHRRRRRSSTFLPALALGPIVEQLGL